MARSHDIRPGTATDMHNPSLQARTAVMEAANEYLGPDDQISVDDVYIVIFTYILSNWKAMVSTTVPDDRYYEVTHNKDTGETYVHVYHKERQKVVPADDVIHNL